MKKNTIFFRLVLFIFLFSGCSSDYNSSIPVENFQTYDDVPIIVETVNTVDYNNYDLNEFEETVENNQYYKDSDLSNDDYYINVDGNKVHSPAYSDTIPSGATAICKDGTYSFSQNRRGTCSGHGGVLKWL